MTCITAKVYRHVRAEMNKYLYNAKYLIILQYVYNKNNNYIISVIMFIVRGKKLTRSISWGILRMCALWIPTQNIDTFNTTLL